MELKEYLQEKLGVSSEEAEKIADCVKEYHHTYGHHHDHRPKNNKPDENVNPPFHLVVESEEQVRADGFDLDKVHCNGCGRQCALSNPNCGRGKMASQLIRNLIQEA